ncbi:MAG TPA: hypothetical protein VMP89_06470 [Solirubrobacteraceae bacterium]|nr:hypothetical protein [Solirubrobacteraceae bacterium]
MPWTLRLFVRRHPWWATAVLIALLSVLMVLYARTRPSYDAYGWLVWGYQTVHLSLDLGGAPSWKPLTYLFTVPFAVFGHYEMWLWMFFSAGVALAGAVFAGRIAYRLSGGGAMKPDDPPVVRYAPIAAAVFAGAAVLGLQDYMHYILSFQSDPMLVTFVLAAIDMHMIGKYRWTLVFGVLATLGRPEAGPWLALWGLWAWIKLPSMRWMLVAGALVVAFGWFGIPTITNGRPLLAGDLAQKSPRALRHNQFFGTLGRFKDLEYIPVWIAALLTLVVAVVRRNRTILVLAAGAVGWVIVEIAFAYHGWPALGRYMFEPAAVGAVLAGVGVGLVLAELPRLKLPQLSRALPRWAGIPVVAVLVGTLVPGAVARIRAERQDLRHERARTHQITLLQTTTNVVGGARHVANCGQPVTDVAYASALAWIYHRDVGSVGGFQQGVEKAELRQNIPKVLIRPVARGGWSVLPWHTRPSQIARCSSLHAEYVVTSRHPAGVLVHLHR